MLNTLKCLMASALVVFAVGCRPMSDAERLDTLVPGAQPTTPVSGQILVDGEPMKDIWVKLHLEGATPETVQPAAQTDEEGKFKITTYIGGDGAPEGEYKITVEWLTWRQFGASWVGPNKLAGVCGDPKTTEFSVSVGSEPIELPAFDVEAKENADSIKPAKGSLAREKHQK